MKPCRSLRSLFHTLLKGVLFGESGRCRTSRNRLCERSHEARSCHKLPKRKHCGFGRDRAGVFRWHRVQVRRHHQADSKNHGYFCRLFEVRAKTLRHRRGCFAVFHSLCADCRDSLSLVKAHKSRRCCRCR